MKVQLKRWLPHPDTIRKARWVRWFGPLLHHPRLWHLSRRGIALGFALGIFFGLLIPVGQIPLAGGAAVLLRANVPIAMASTFVSNPVTFGPLYYLAYKLGVLLVGSDDSALPPGFDEHGAWPDPTLVVAPVDSAEHLGFFAASWARIGSMGKPLLVGLSVIAVSGGLLAHMLVNLAWRLNARMAWRRRVRERRKRRALAEAAQLETDCGVSAAADSPTEHPQSGPAVP